MFQPRTITTIESGNPQAMHAPVSRPLAGQRFVADIREYRWEAPVVSSGWTDCAQLLWFAGRWPSRPESTYSRSGGRRTGHKALGDIILIPPNQTLHSVCPAGDQRALSCMFAPRLLPAFAQIDWSEDRLLETLDIRCPNIRAGLARMAAEVTAPGLAAGILVEGIVLTLVVELTRIFGESRRDPGPAGPKLSTRQLRMITDQLAGEPFCPSLAALASQCGISRRHLVRMFKNTTRTTLGAYILEMRVARAEALLTNKNIQIKEVAYRCGFRSAAAFSAAFHRATGQTPSSFRQQLVGPHLLA
jgi:AraC family transcriptional regulator